MHDVAVSLDIPTVDAERETASDVISGMKTVGRRVDDTAAGISKADNPIAFVDSLSSTLKSLGKFNSIVDKIAMVRNYAIHLLHQRTHRITRSTLMPKQHGQFSVSSPRFAYYTLLSNDKKFIPFDR